MANTATMNPPTTPGRRAPRSQSRNKGVAALKQQADAESNRQQVERWMRLSRKELDAIYLKARPGRLPLGDTRGTALFAGWPGAKSGSENAGCWILPLNSLTRPRPEHGEAGLMKALINRTKATLSRVHPLPQNDLTLRFPIIQNREKRLRELLSALAEDPAHNDLLPFVQFRQLHFARFLVLEGEKHPEEYGSTLIFLANVDGPLASFLEQLTSDHSQALDRILSTCEGYPTRTWRSHATRIGYLYRHQLASQAYYVNTLGRSAEQIRQEEQLYQALQQFLNNLDPDLPFSASTIRDAAIAYVADHPDLAWALTPRPRPGLLWRTWETTRFRVLVALGILGVIWGWPDWSHNSPMRQKNPLISH